MSNIYYQTKSWLFGLVLIAAHILPGFSEGAMRLNDRLQRAEVGDYIVTAIDHTYSVLIIKDKPDSYMSIEEITIPAAQIQRLKAHWQGWRHWVESGAPGNTSWVVYTMESGSGRMAQYYSYTKNAWCNLSSVDNFLSKLLNLQLARVPRKDLKRVGPVPREGQSDQRRYWEPQMIYEGKIISGVSFEAWRTTWPRDDSDLSGKSIFVYVPKEDARYPSYFPYWLEIRGVLGKAKVRIIDSGRNLHSFQKAPQVDDLKRG